MATNIPFRQDAPSVALKTVDENKMEDISTTVQSIITPTIWDIRPSEQADADNLLLWLVRYPTERNHPRALTGAVELWTGKEVLTVKNTDSVIKAFKGLVAEGFLSAPVEDLSNRYVGFIDMLDLVYHTLNSFETWSDTWSGTSGVTQYTTSKDGRQVPTVDSWNSFFNENKFKNATVADIALRNTPGYNKQLFHPVNRSFSLFHCVEMMARNGVHRVPVLDRQGAVVGILTQSMVISLLSQNLWRLGSLRYIRVSEIIPILSTQVESISENEYAVMAFRKMAQQNVLGLAILNADGKLVDSMSVRDLRGIGVDANNFLRLWSTVKTYKEQVRRDYPRQTPRKPITCTTNDTLEYVINNMFDGNIHRLWVVDNMDTQRPLSVITQRDVLRFLLFRCGLMHSEP